MGASSGYGQINPNDFSDDLTATAAIVRAMIAEMSTMSLVQVHAVHGGGVAPAGTVDVIPLVSQIDGNGYPTPHGIVPGIPWSRVQGGLNAVICDPVAGDIGYVVTSDRDISVIKNTKAAGQPGSRRRNDIADGVYVGGCLNAAPTCYIQFTADGHFTIVDVDGNMLTSSSTGWTITPKTGQSVIINGNLIVEQNLQLSGSIKSVSGSIYGGSIQTLGNVIAGFGGADQIGLQTHLHTSGGTGNPTSAPTAGT